MRDEAKGEWKQAVMSPDFACAIISVFNAIEFTYAGIDSLTFNSSLLYNSRAF